MSATVAIPKKTSGLNETDKLLIRIGAYTLGGLVLGTTVFLIGRKIYRNAKQKQSAQKILTDNTPESHAERLHKALFDGLWADVNIVRQVITEIPSQQEMAKVATAYQHVSKEGKSSLYLDLAKKLTTQEMFEMQNIIAVKPGLTGQKAVFDMKAAAAMAKRIKSAFDYTWMGMDGTDKKALKAALLEIPSLYAFAMVKVAYKNLYHTNIEDELDSELDAFDFSWKDIVYTKRKR